MISFIRLVCSMLLLGSSTVVAEISLPADAGIYLQAPDGAEPAS